MISGLLLTVFPWNSIFFVILPLAVVALTMAVLFVPGHVHETSEPVDNLGGFLSLILVGALILAINFAPVPEQDVGARLGPHRRGRLGGLCHPATAHRQPAL
ncbi:MAG: hypothetical protein R2851_09375 [Caldilineaceae bacterium]